MAAVCTLHGDRHDGDVLTMPSAQLPALRSVEGFPVNWCMAAGGSLHGAGKAWRGAAGVPGAAAECGAAGAAAAHKGMGMAVLTVRVQMAAAGRPPGTVQTVLRSSEVLPLSTFPSSHRPKGSPFSMGVQLQSASPIFP